MAKILVKTKILVTNGQNFSDYLSSMRFPNGFLLLFEYARKEPETAKNKRS